MGSIQIGTNSTGRTVSLIVLQAQVKRFADEYSAMVAQAADDYAADANTSDARLQALKWKLGQATSAYVDATGMSPALNAVDLLVLATLSRMVIEDFWVKQSTNAAATQLLETHRKLESQAWDICRSFLKPNQQREVTELIQEWRQRNPNQRYVGAIRFREFVVALGKSLEQKNVKANSVFGFLFIDPLAGLDPTTTAIEETRLTAERIMYYTQRMPILLTWQVEMLAYQLADQPESKALIEDVDRLSNAAETFARTAAQLPQVISSEREAAIRQVFQELVSQEKSAVGVLAETRETLNASSKAATTINTAIASLTQFVQSVSPTNNAASAGSTNSTPFNVLDYGTAATQIGEAARQVNALLDSANDSVARMEQLSETAAARADRIMRHAFVMGLILIGVFLAGLVLAGLVYRALVRKMNVAERSRTE